MFVYARKSFRDESLKKCRLIQRPVTNAESAGLITPKRCRAMAETPRGCLAKTRILVHERNTRVLAMRSELKEYSLDWLLRISFIHFNPL